MNAPIASRLQPRIWTQAAKLAAQTPDSRNRFVDFLRALSITAVITGHWLVVAPYMEAGVLVPAEILSIVPWTRWLTWVFQVMPIFFLVGGYANSLSWQSAQRRGQHYSDWLAARLQRLIRPVLPVLVVWAVIGLVAGALQVDAAILRVASQFALLPAWFLVIYVIVVILVPVAYVAWARFGFGSFWGLAACAVGVDVLALGVGWRAVGWVNYLFIWLAVHQLGFAWQAGRLVGLRKTSLWAIGGLAVLIALVTFGPYPVSMVSVGGEEISNSLPPNLTMLAIGVFQTGLLLSLESRARRWLQNSTPWTATVLVNGMIMTIFMWHVTAMLLLAATAVLFGGAGLNYFPGSAGWWLTRPVWLGLLLAVLLIFVAFFIRFERPGSAKQAATPPVWRLLLGSALICYGLAMLTLNGVTTQNPPGVRLVELALPFIGAALAAFGPLQRLTHTADG